MLCRVPRHVVGRQCWDLRHGPTLWPSVVVFVVFVVVTASVGHARTAMHAANAMAPRLCHVGRTRGMLGTESQMRRPIPARPHWGRGQAVVGLCLWPALSGETRGHTPWVPVLARRCRRRVWQQTKTVREQEDRRLTPPSRSNRDKSVVDCASSRVL